MPTTTSSAASSSSSVSGNNRQADVFSRLASSDPEVKLKALRDVKNQIIGNRTKKLSFLKLGAIPAIASVLADADDSDKCNNILVQSAPAIGSFACGFEAGVQAVLDAGVFPHLLRLLTNPDEKVDESSKSAVPQSHPLEHSWTFWFDNPSVKSKQTTWGSSLRPVFTFSTVEEFWSLYNNMKHPSKLAHGVRFGVLGSG